MLSHIQRELAGGGVCILRFDQADAAANVFNAETLAELESHVRFIATHTAVKGVVFMSAKERVFHAGADLRVLKDLETEKMWEFLFLGQGVFNQIAALKVPTVAAIHGACVGGGYEMALACRYRIATPDRATKIGLPETRLGILPGWGGSTRLPKLVGVPRALDIILGGKTPPAKLALKFGMIDLLAPREYLLSAAVRLIEHGLPRRKSMLVRLPALNALAGRLMRFPAQRQTMRKTRGHYPALLKAIEIITSAVSSPEKESLERERTALIEFAGTATCKNLIRLFLQQEKARKSSGPKAPRLARAAVIGAGVMGAGIAQWLASRGVSVILRDVEPARVAAGMARIGKLFNNRRVFTKKEARDAMDRISPAARDVPLRRVEIVIEAAVEVMGAKKEIFAHLDSLASGHDTILATNTSALSIAEIASATEHPARVVGFHFFNPVHKMPLVEVIAAPQTDPETLQRAVRFAQQIGKLPVVVKDSPGFLVNRILLPYLVEAGLLFEAGALVRDIDEAMLDFGMPMGPLRLIDEVGVDIAQDVAATLAEKFIGRMSVPAVLAKMLEEKWFGRKSGRGFYVHPGAGRATVNKAAERFRGGTSAAALDRAQLQRRLVLLMVNEAARCVEEAIVASPDEVDLAMVMGTGFAPFLGGPLRYADAVGANNIVDDLNRFSASSGSHYAPCELLRRMAADGKHIYED